MGVAKMLQHSAGPGCGWYCATNYWYVRPGNAGALGWIKAVRPDFADGLASKDEEMPGMPVTVHHFPARRFTGSSAGIRAARRSDTKRCIALVNRTHRGLDFFRSYTEEFLQQRLDDPMWGPRPVWWASVYDWSDYFVLEEAGNIIACAGLWDRGRHVREVWVHKDTGERQVLECTALMDYGYDDGREDAMARLLGYLIGRTQELGRSELMAGIEWLPKLVERVHAYEPSTETRALNVDVYNDEEGIDLEVTVTRPYTDLAYW
jgi:hypothetical protein